MQDLMLNQLAPISNPKNKKVKTLYAFFEWPFFIFRTNEFNKGFSFFPTILDGWEDSFKLVWFKKLSWFRQKFCFLLINFVSRVPSFYIQTKVRLKNRLTTVHLLQCKINFFIYVCFWGRNLLQNKEHPSWETSINTKKIFFDSSALVYICLYSPTFV